MEIVPGIHLIDGSVGCNTYLIINEDLTLVDTGLRGNVARIERYLDKLDYKLKDIKRIVITHAHIDHVNCLYQLKQETGAVVITGEHNADFVAGKKQVHKSRGIFGLIFGVVGIFYKYKPVPVDLELKDGARVPGVPDMTAISLPGHSEGNMGLYSPSRKILFSSDSVRVIDGKVVPPNDKFTANMVEAVESIKKMSELEFTVLLPGHGNPVTADAVGKIRQLYREIKH